MVSAILHHPLIDPEPPKPRRSPHKFFFCCCNMRDSVVAVQIILGIIFAAVWITAYGAGYLNKHMTNPQIAEDIENAYSKVIVLSGAGIIVAVITIIGAVRYNIGLVLLGAVYAVIENVLCAYYTYPVMKDISKTPGWYIAWPVIHTLLFLYPHVGFIYEVKTGILGSTSSDSEAQEIL